MDKNNNIEFLLKQILENQSRTFDIETNQKVINKELRDDLNDLNRRIMTQENNFILLSKQYETTISVIQELQKTMKDISDNQIRLIENVKGERDKTKNHSKIFWTMLSLNFSIILAVIIQFIRKLI